MMTLIWGLEAYCLLAMASHLASAVITGSRCRTSKLSRRPPPQAPAVSLVRPVCGIDHFETETLRSAFELDYPSYELIFCVAHSSDPVVPLIEHLMARYPHVPARLLVGDDRVSDNPKLNNVVKGWRAAAHDWIVIADSNVLMPRDYLQCLLAAWRPGDTGLVCSPPIGCWPLGMEAEVECAFLNTYQARWQYFADSIGLGFAQGKTMLWRRDFLEQAGGIRVLGGEIAEDAASTKVVRKAGLRVRLVDGAFGQPLGARTAGEVWRRQLRWARLRRATFKLFFAPEILAGSLSPLMAAGFVAAERGLPVATTLAALAVIWYGTEGLLARAAGWHVSMRSPFAWVIRDLLLPVLWVNAWLGSSFIWRGNHMRVGDLADSNKGLSSN